MRISDWSSDVCSSDLLQVPQVDDPAFRRYVDLGHLRFTMATAEETAAIMRESGFEAVTTVDRNAWYAEVSAGEAAAIAGPLRDEIIAASDVAPHERPRESGSASRGARGG